MSTAYSPGLEGVTAGISKISEVDADRNQLIYRGYDVKDLVQQCDFDEVAYLLLYGKLPNAAEYADFRLLVGENRDVPDVVYELLTHFPPDTHPMDALKAAVATLAAFDPERDINTSAANLNKAVRLYAQMPALVVNGYRILKNLPPITPLPTQGHNANFFRLLLGPKAKPNPYFLEVLNMTQILYAEHGFNASTFAARVTVSTLSDLHSGVVSAIGTLKGPLHGGANEAAMAMLEEIGDASRAAEWVRTALAEKKKIMGFGHREYKHGDERAKIVKQYAVELGKRVGNTRWADVSQIVEDEMLRAKGLHPNLDFPVASTYTLMNIPVPLFTPIFVMSRITGWCAHIIEQLGNNRIIRPHSEYDGPRNLQVVAIGERA
jgi:2-methylcitrate synthase/citrate synthase II